MNKKQICFHSSVLTFQYTHLKCNIYTSKVKELSFPSQTGILKASTKSTVY